VDINAVRTAVTILSLIGFVGIAVWAYWPGNREKLDEQGRSVLADEGKGR
jgi:cytochrome c oxidase cbb3-type subunit IV